VIQDHRVQRDHLDQGVSRVLKDQQDSLALLVREDCQAPQDFQVNKVILDFKDQLDPEALMVHQELQEILVRVETKAK